MNLEIQQKKEKGITLIELVITIIVLLILAGVTIATLTGDNGILTKANEAKDKNTQEKAKELIMLEFDSSFNLNGEFDKNLFEKNMKKNLGVNLIINENGTYEGEYEKEYFYIYNNNKIRIGEKMELGNYFKYDVPYIDINTKKEYTYKNGWKILDILPEDGTIKIISTGIPAKLNINSEVGIAQWSGNVDEVNLEYGKNFTSIEENKNGYAIAYGLKYKFKDLIFRPDNIELNNEAGYIKIDGNETGNIKGEVFLKNNASEVHNITLEELNHARNKDKSSLDDIKTESNNVFKDIFDTGYTYWLSTLCSDTRGVWFLYKGESFYHYCNYETFGIRPVITIPLN